MNAYTYTVYKTTGGALSRINLEGFVGYNESTDGLMRIVDRKNAIEPPTGNWNPSKPSYVVEAMSNWPHLTHTESVALIGYLATTAGGSDGWSQSSNN